MHGFWILVHIIISLCAHFIECLNESLSIRWVLWSRFIRLRRCACKVFKVWWSTLRTFLRLLNCFALSSSRLPDNYIRLGILRSSILWWFSLHLWLHCLFASRRHVMKLLGQVQQQTLLVFSEVPCTSIWKEAKGVFFCIEKLVFEIPWPTTSIGVVVDKRCVFLFNHM